MKKVFIDSWLKATMILSLVLGAQGVVAQTKVDVGEDVAVVQDTLVLTLEQALEIAMSDNLTVKVAEQEIVKKDYAKKGAYSALFPQVDFSSSYQRTLAKQRMYIDGAGFPEDGIEVGLNNNMSMGFNASMPIISAPLWNSLKLSASEVELAVELARSSQLDMIQLVKQAFYGVLMAEDSYRVFNEQYQFALINYNDIKINFEQGRVSEYDLIRSDVSVKNIEPNLYDAENSIILAKWRLKALLGVDLEISVKCDGTLRDYESELLRDYSNEDLSLDNNTQLKQIEIQSDMLVQTKKMQMSEYLPSLNAMFSYQWNAMSNNFKMSQYRWDPFSTVGLSLNIPIFSGGKRYNATRLTKASMIQLEWQKEDVVRNLQVSLRQSLDQMRVTMKQFGAAQQGVIQAEKGYTISVMRYDTGKGTLLEINDSRLQLTQSKLNLSTSIFNYLVARTNIEKILGQESVTE